MLRKPHSSDCLPTFKAWKLAYRRNVERSYIVTLFGLILLFLIFPRMPRQPRETPKPRLVFTLENIPPITAQRRPGAPPPLPEVPIPSEDESLPEDDTIEITNLDLARIPMRVPGPPGLAVAPRLVPPRPIAEVFPEYPDDLKERVAGVVTLMLHVDTSGTVIEAKILENTTGAPQCAAAAVKAARAGRYVAARSGGRPVEAWITRPYRFN